MLKGYLHPKVSFFVIFLSVLKKNFYGNFDPVFEKLSKVRSRFFTEDDKAHHRAEVLLCLKGLQARFMGVLERFLKTFSEPFSKTFQRYSQGHFEPLSQSHFEEHFQWDFEKHFP